jgi:glycosyltransferase involved in cell wall biosynthesis
MISVVIETCDNDRTLGQCLSALVTAAIDGLVREAILADAGSTDDTLEIAEDAGARVVTEGLDAACKSARSDWLLIVKADHVAPEGWDTAVYKSMRAGLDHAAWWGKASLLGKPDVQALLVSKKVFEAAGYDGALKKAKRLKL